METHFNLSEVGLTHLKPGGSCSVLLGSFVGAGTHLFPDLLQLLPSTGLSCGLCAQLHVLARVWVPSHLGCAGASLQATLMYGEFPQPPMTVSPSNTAR